MIRVGDHVLVIAKVTGIVACGTGVLTEQGAKARAQARALCYDDGVYCKTMPLMPTRPGRKQRHNRLMRDAAMEADEVHEVDESEEVDIEEPKPEDEKVV